MKEIRLKACGKWILAGEYAVLKGYSALAFPLPSQFMELCFSQMEKKTLRIQTTTLVESEKYSEKNLQIFFESALQKALKILSRHHKELNGLLKLDSYMLSSSGLGSSSVICTLMGKLFHALGWLKKKDLFSFCHTLEKALQEGESSGLDIRVILEEQAILYKDPNQWRFFHPSWKPCIFLSYSGSGQNTSANIQSVQKLWQKEPQKMKPLYEKMELAVLKAKNSLNKDSNASLENRLKELQEAFLIAEDCFSEWGLIGEDMRKHIQFLKKYGALAVKPTGSGSGGYVLSLWPTQTRPQTIPHKLLHAF